MLQYTSTLHLNSVSFGKLETNSCKNSDLTVSFAFLLAYFASEKQPFLHYLTRVKVGIDINCDNKCSSRTQMLRFIYFTAIPQITQTLCENGALL